jgi:hypothetical protein
MATRMQQRRGTAQQWTDADPRLESGEIGFETDTNQFKIGDGVNVWSDLSYFKNLEDLGGSFDDYVLANSVGSANGIASLNDLGKIPTSQLPDALSFDAEVTNAVSTAMATEVADRNTAISTARSNAISVASEDATTKANAAQGNAATDATTKANAAQAAAEATAAADATTKANNANAFAVSTAANALTAHNSATLNVHGIANTEALATKAYVDSAAASVVTGLVDGAPELLNTINELAAAIDDNATFANTVLSSVNSAQVAAQSYGEGFTANAISAHSIVTSNVHGIADTTQLATMTFATTAASMAQGNAEATAANALSLHNSTTSNVHGIANTLALALSSDVQSAIDAATTALDTHGSDTSNVHGIADTAALATKTYADASATSAQGNAEATAASALSSHNSNTLNVHGIANTAALATTADVATAKSEAISDAGTAADTKVSTAVAALTKSSVGLGNVDNTADSAKPVSTAQANAIATAKAEAIADATSQVDALLTGAPAALNTLDELAAALGDDANFASTVTTNLAAKAPLASPTFTGTVTVAASGVAFTDGTQTRAGVPSITTFATAISSSATLAAGEQDKFVPLTGAVTITLPASGYSTGQSIDFYQASGTGASFAATNSVVGTPGLKFRTTNSVVTAMKTSSGWLVFGDLSA